MTAWGWAGSAPAPSTADLESAPRLPPMAVAVAGAAEEEDLALAPVRPDSEGAVGEEGGGGVWLCVARRRGGLWRGGGEVWVGGGKGGGAGGAGAGLAVPKAKKRVD